MKRLHKILVIVLTLSMLLGVIVVSAFAADDTVAKIGDTEYSSIADAVAAANAATDVTDDGIPKPITITLTKDVALGAGEGITLTLDNLSLTIDLGGHTLDVSGVGPIKDPSNIGVPRDREIKAAIYARGVDSVLTVKNGLIVNSGEKNGVFTIEKNMKANLVIDGVTVNSKGTSAMPLINARDGKTTVINSELVSYGTNSAVIRQSGNAEVIVEDSELFNIDGKGNNSTVIKTETTATGILFEEVPIEAPTPAAEGDGEGEILEPEVEIVERPHVLVKNSELFGASNVILAHVTGEGRPAGSVKPWLVFEGCDITQANSNAYNREDNLLTESNNNLLRGNHAIIEFNDCTAEYARVAFNTGEKLEVTVSGGSFSMTHKGQYQYFKEVTQAITECDSYFVMGKGKVSLTGTAIYLATLPNGKFAPIADQVALNFAAGLDIMSKEGLKIGDGCATNSTEDLAALDVLALACRLHKLAEGNYIGIFAFTKDEWSGNWYSNKYEAKLNGERYATFAEAYAKANDGDTIELLSDVSGMQTIEKSINIRNFVGFDIMHTSTTHKSANARGYIEFSPAGDTELVSVKLVTDTGVDEMFIAKGNYAVYTGTLSAGWRFSGYKVINFKGWGETPNEANLGENLPYVDGSNSTITLYAVFEEKFDLDADYAVTKLDGELIAFGGSFSELTKLNNAFLKDKYNEEGADPTSYEDKVIVLLKDIYTDKPISVDIGGSIYLDLNGHKIVTNNNPIYKSDLSNYIYQYDGAKAEGKTPVRMYDKPMNVYNLVDGKWVKSSEPRDKYYAKAAADDPQMTDYAVSLGDFELYEGRNADGVTAKVYIFSSQPGAVIDTGDSPALDITSHMRIRMYNADKSKELINSNTNFNEVYFGNVMLGKSMAQRVGDNQIFINCTTLGDYSDIYNHKTYIDDLYIVGNYSNGTLSSGRHGGGLRGHVHISNSTIVNNFAGAGVVGYAKLMTASATDSTFVATPKDGVYPDFISTLEFHKDSGKAFSYINCNLINCYLSTANRVTNKNTAAVISIKNVNYNVKGATTGGTIPLVMDEAYTVNEEAVWNIPVTVGDEVYYLAYKTLLGEAPEIVTVTWCDSEGNPLEVTETKFFKGAKVLYPGALSDGAVSGAAYSKLMKFTLSADEGVNLDSIQSDATVKVGEVAYGIDAEVDVRHNVNISSELTVSIYVPKLSGITNVSLFTPDGDNLIDEDNVKTIGEVEYYVITSVAISPNQIHRNIIYAITVSDGTYTEVVYKSVSILGYAEKLLADSEASNEAKALVKAMLVYANESYKYFDGEANADVAALIGAYELAAPAAESAKDVTVISEYVLSAHLQLKSRMAFVFEVAEGVESLTIGGEEYAAAGGYVVYDCDVAAANDTLSINVGEASGAYDLIAYIAATAPVADELTAYNLAIALYSFASAADAYVAAQ